MVPDVTVTNPRNCFKPPVAVIGEVPVELVVPKTVKVPDWLMVVPAKTRFSRIALPAPLQVDAFNVVVPAPVKLMLPIRVKFPFIVIGTAPALERVTPVPTVTGPNVKAFPWIVWLAVVEKVVIPVPEIVKVPLLVIPL
jgi:hypothetical protein